MHIELFRQKFQDFLATLNQTISTDNGDWSVKGFIDIYKNIYTISTDTKVVSKLIELMIFPCIANFSEKNGYKLILSNHQNHYPDLTLILRDDSKIAIDLKSTYRVSDKDVNGLTLGAFTGYFRKRDSNKNITFPYQDYAEHFVLGCLYSRKEINIDEKQAYTIEELTSIPSVITDIKFFLQEKWKIATDRPGSGNTKNIGSVTKINNLLTGNGPFAPYGLTVFDDYWMNYLTTDMARAIESVPSYKNLQEYLEWRKLGATKILTSLPSTLLDNL